MTIYINNFSRYFITGFKRWKTCTNGTCRLLRFGSFGGVHPSEVLHLQANHLAAAGKGKHQAKPGSRVSSQRQPQQEAFVKRFKTLMLLISVQLTNVF